MSPSFVVGDRLLVLRTHQVNLGDAILFADEHRTYIKRVAGLAGDTMDCWGQPFELNTDEIYVLGDNSDRSTDSRHFGPIHKQQIIGRALLIYYPRFKLLCTTRP